MALAPTSLLLPSGRAFGLVTRGWMKPIQQSIIRWQSD